MEEWKQRNKMSGRERERKDRKKKQLNNVRKAEEK